MSDRQIINLPFAGFYESIYSGEIDYIEERDCEYHADEMGGEESKYPPELRLSADDYAGLYYRHTTYPIAYRHIAKEYVASFDQIASDELGLKLGLEFESMDSPREYNFATDRVYAFIAPETITALFAMSAVDDHARLAATIADRFTSYDGFISGYPNGIDSWLAKPLADWDHNELGTLLIAMLSKEDRRDFYNSIDGQVFNHMCGSNDFDTARDLAVDWPAFDKARGELRAEKEAELRELDPDYIPAAVRCEQTIDMFTDRAG